MHSVLYLGPALHYFFRNARIDIYHGELVINLMDWFPLLKQGHGSMKTVYSMMHVYIDINNLGDHLKDFVNDNYLIPDDLFIAAFNGQYQIFEFPPQISSRSLQQYQIDDAVDAGIINKNMNTFQTLQALYTKFDHRRVRISLLYSIIRANSLPVTLNHPELNDIIEDPDVIKQIDSETLYSLELDKILNIILKEMQLMLTLLNSIDHIPMDPIQFTDLIRLGNYNIVDAIKNKIIERNWYSRQVYESELLNIISESSTLASEINRNCLSRRF